MHRRNFLGWLGATGGTVAIYKQIEIPQAFEAVAPLVDTPHAACYVIKNHDPDRAMVVNYKREGGTFDRPHGTKYGNVHVSTILLPGEELTITAVPAKLV